MSAVPNRELYVDETKDHDVFFGDQQQSPLGARVIERPYDIVQPCDRLTKAAVSFLDEINKRRELNDIEPCEILIPGIRFFPENYEQGDVIAFTVDYAATTRPLGKNTGRPFDVKDIYNHEVEQTTEPAVKIIATAEPGKLIVEPNAPKITSYQRTGKIGKVEAESVIFSRIEGLGIILQTSQGYQLFTSLDFNVSNRLYRVNFPLNDPHPIGTITSSTPKHKNGLSKLEIRELIRDISIYRDTDLWNELTKTIPWHEAGKAALRGAAAKLHFSR